MPVPSTIDQISPTASLNSPAGSENVFPDIDNHIRALAAFTAQLRDGSGTNYTSPYLLKAGGTMTGALTLAADPASAMQAATKQYADTMLPLAGGRCEGPDAGMPERVGREAGVRIPGDGINGVMGAFGRIGERMRFVQARHEELAAFMAAAHCSCREQIVQATGRAVLHPVQVLRMALPDAA